MSDEHEQKSELLPWYVNKTLAGREAAAVERHLLVCAECQKEAAQLQALMAGDEEDGWTPSPAHFAKVMAKVDALSQPRWPRAPSWMRETPRPMRIAFALQAAAMLALVAGVALRSPARYETLSRPPIAATDRSRLHVVFSSDITEGEIRRLLEAAQASIVAGPSPDGIYTVELSLPAADEEAARKVSERLKANPKVRFAAPVAR
jgi:anti-sigma factor RsiW